MKKSFTILSALITALVLLIFTSTASAAQITFVSVAGNWHDPTDNVPGNQPGQPTIVNGVPTSSINWGVTSGSQSGYDFSRSIPGAQTLPPAPTPFFPLGTFTHRNFPVSDPSLTSVQLDVVLVLNVDGVQTGPLKFTFTFNHEETPNNQMPCPYPTPPGEGCTDRVTFVSSPSPTTFNVGGVDYTLSMSFVVNGNPVSEFITREGLINTASLVGQFTLPPSAIPEPLLTVTKSGPAAMGAGQWGNFGLDVHNTGNTDAWQTSIRDMLPRGATGGMCDLTPEILSAQVFAADGVTPVPGKGPLVLGTDYLRNYTASPTCQLDLSFLTAAARIAPNERLIIQYRTQLDANTQDGIALTNIAGAIQWFNDDTTNPARTTFTRTLTNGTPGTVDHEDAHTVTVALAGYFFEKTVADLTTGASPAVTAAPGDRLRYTLRFRTANQPLNGFRIFDELDALNSSAAFAPNTLALVAYPAGADISATSSTGGAKGTGVIDIRNLNIPASGEVVVQFDITLASTLPNSSVVANQATLRLSNGTVFAISDDPNVNGAANPNVAGDEDQTKVTIATAIFRLQKTSADLTGDPNLLLAGETLRYTITAKNIGSSDAVNVVLRDLVPVNTSYVAGSTTLNGVAVPDSGGQSSLVNGMLINSPGSAAGTMPADASNNTANVATITFNVTVTPGVVNGTVISNQGFLSAPGSGIADQPSDDPNTAIANDPTRNVVGALPLLYADKQAVLISDLSSPGIVDPGDVLRYTIHVQNSGAVAATGVVLKDVVPANTTYVANSTSLNGAPVGQPDGGVSPLVSGINVGTVSPGATSTIQFDLRVNAGTPAGTMIRNQAAVNSVELPTVLTDGDGNPATGPEPTVVVVGIAQELSIAAQVSVVGGGAALPGATLEYAIRIANISAVPATNVVLTDNLDLSQPGQLSYVAGSATVNGSTSGFSFAGSTLTANYGASSGTLAPGGVVVLRFRAILNPSLAMGAPVMDTGVVTWNSPTQTASASVSLFVGGIPGESILNGIAYHDANFNNIHDAGEPVLAGWTVDVYRGTQLVASVVTDSNGAYHVIGLQPNDAGGATYELRFSAPGAIATTAALGIPTSPFTNGEQRITNIVVSSGANLQNLDLPIEPNGVVYNSVARAPVVGATLTMLDAVSGTPLPASCFNDPAQQGQVTLADGFYKFDINFSNPACPSGGEYQIAVTAPGANYIAGYSQIIPPDATPFSVPACLGSLNDAIPSTTQFCEVQPFDIAPAISVQPRSAGTVYHVVLRLDNSQMPGSSQIFNNQIPLDPELNGTIAITKTTPLLNVTRGQQVPYVITVNNHGGALITGVGIVDRLPAGFTYVKGSAILDGVATEPSVVGTALSWNGLSIALNQTRTLKLLVIVGAGVSEGDFVNHAQVVNSVTGGAMSGEVSATVRIVPDPTFDCTDVTGMVFNDKNRNGRQDGNEPGLSGVRVVTPGGLGAMTDPFGRYHITCALTPNESRGSNFILKLDDRTLPSGFRMSTDSVQVQRATRGKNLTLNFGASIYHVVAIDISDAVFESGTTEIRAQWKPRMDLLLEELRKAPGVLRLSYVADIEDKDLVERRMEAIKRQLTKSWEATKSGYSLSIEPEIFWRRGAPVKKPDVRLSGSK
jgi:uncharacterized repeat protein (TIGR01451 family)